MSSLWTVMAEAPGDVVVSSMVLLRWQGGHERTGLGHPPVEHIIVERLPGHHDPPAHRAPRAVEVPDSGLGQGRVGVVRVEYGR